jgi:hypothetical protein
MRDGRQLGRGAATLVALLSCLVAAGAASALATAHAARAAASPQPQQVTEDGTLVRIARHGTDIMERGTATGTYDGPIWFQIKAEENTVYFSFQFRTHLGEISGSGSIRVRAASPRSTITGTVAATHGTGYFAHISAPHLQVSGTMVTATDATNLQVQGAMRR